MKKRKELDKLICNLIGTIEIINVATEKANELIKEIKEKHEHYNREDGTWYE